VKRKKDERVNAKRFGFMFFCIIFAVFIAISLAFLGIYLSAPKGDAMLRLYLVAALASFIGVMSGISIALLNINYRRSVIEPLEKLSEAAKQVAEGDFSVRLPPLRKDGKKDAFVLLFEDFNTMVSELDSVQMLKSDFVANVSHEIKTPLSVIANYSSMLQSDGITAAEKNEYSAKIAEETKRLSCLVSDILQLSRLENQKIVVSPERYNLSEQLCRCIIGFEKIWEERNIEIVTDLDSGLYLNSDENLLDIVWNNLLSNALKFTPDGGEVKVTAKERDGYAVITVADSGCGMSENDLRHIFEKFYQADTSHKTSGNGLGLALTLEIIRLVKGRIRAESVIDKGSRFTVTLGID